MAGTAGRFDTTGDRDPGAVGMLAYYLELAVRSLRRNIPLMVLLVMVVGFGIGASMTVLTTLRAMAIDPIPDKSSQLFVPQIDAWGPPTRPRGGPDAGNRLPDQLTYRDAVALVKAQRAIRQTAMYAVSLNMTGADGAPTPISGHALPLTPGKHKVTFVMGDDRYTFPVTITAGQTQAMTKDLE